jgi:hypothetical protein
MSNPTLAANELLAVSRIDGPCWLNEPADVRGWPEHEIKRE